MNFKITPVEPKTFCSEGESRWAHIMKSSKALVLAASLATVPLPSSTFPTMATHRPTPPLCFFIDFTTSEEFLMGERA